MYTVSDIKTCHSNLWHNFGKCWPSCTFLSLLDSTINLQQDPSLLYFPSYPKCVTTLHCEIQKITISKSVMPLTQEHRCTCSFYRVKKLEVWTCMSLSQIKRTKCPFWHEYMRKTLVPLIGCIIDHACTKPRQTSNITHAASVCHCHELVFGRAVAAFLPKSCSQLDSVLDCWGPQGRWNESGCLPLQKADWFCNSYDFK